MMKKITYILLLSVISCLAWAQQKAPKWMEKKRKAVVEITTYKKDGSELHRGTGFFVSENGEILSAYSLFKDASRAVAKDTKGNLYPVSTIIGADELYDVIRVKAEVPKKANCLELAQEKPAQGSLFYLLPFATEKIKRFGQGTVQEVTKLKEDYGYYQISIPLTPDWVNAPVMTETGEVFGLAQADASGKNEHSFAVSARYANRLSVGAMDALNTAYTSIGIRKAWPQAADQAQIMLLLLQGKEDASTFLETVNDFIRVFPEHPDGYLSRASLYAYSRNELGGAAECLPKALENIRAYQKKIQKKSEGLYQEAKLLYGVASSDSTLNDPAWSVERALSVLQEAINADEEPLYHQLRADIYFQEGNWEKAFDEYMVVNKSAGASAATWYMAAKIRQTLPNVNIGEIISLLDSAVTSCGTPITAEAAPYVLERIDWKLKLMQYKEAIADYDLYYELMNGRVNDSFYYFREQAKFKMNDLEGALSDIREAIRLAPENANYLAEEASVLIRQTQYGEALKSIEKALVLAPDFAACYRLRGVCLIRENQSAEACSALRKAEELGDPVATKLLKEHCQ